MHADLSNLTFLIVDDNAYGRRIIRSMLAAFGVRGVIEAGDGAEAMIQLEEHIVDFIIVDWEMPILDGQEFVKLVRTPEHVAAYVPIILVTAHTKRARVIAARDIGVHEVLCKPLSAGGLYKRIAYTLLRPRKFIQTPTYFGPEPRGGSIGEFVERADNRSKVADPGIAEESHREEPQAARAPREAPDQEDAEDDAFALL